LAIWLGSSQQLYNKVTVRDITVLSSSTTAFVDSSNTRLVELSNNETWAQANNMTLNRFKSIIFTNHKRRQQVDQPPPLLDIARVSIH